MNDPKKFSHLNLVELERLASTWAEDDQMEEGVNQLTGKLRVTPLLNEPQEAGV